MKVRVHKDSAEASKAAADDFVRFAARPGPSNVMLACGNTPIRLYQDVAARDVRLEHLTVFCLDEYLGVPEDEPRTCAHFIREAVVRPWRVPPPRFRGLRTSESEAVDGIREYEQHLARSGGVDLLVLGLGKNGHLGFNEPGSAPDSIGRVVDLSESSIEAGRDWFDGRYAPTRGVTVGLRTILSARQILLLAFGDAKMAAVARMVDGPPHAECPASWLQGHPNVHAYFDRASASGLSDR